MILDPITFTHIALGIADTILAVAIAAVAAWAFMRRSKQHDKPNAEGEQR
jgi:hypothetical protein